MNEQAPDSVQSFFADLERELGIVLKYKREFKRLYNRLSKYDQSTIDRIPKNKTVFTYLLNRKIAALENDLQELETIMTGLEKFLERRLYSATERRKKTVQDINNVLFILIQDIRNYDSLFTKAQITTFNDALAAFIKQEWKQDAETEQNLTLKNLDKRAKGWFGIPDTFFLLKSASYRVNRLKKKVAPVVIQYGQIRNQLSRHEVQSDIFLLLLGYMKALKPLEKELGKIFILFERALGAMDKRHKNLLESLASFTEHIKNNERVGRQAKQRVDKAIDTYKKNCAHIELVLTEDAKSSVAIDDMLNSISTLAEKLIDVNEQTRKRLQEKSAQRLAA